MQHISTPASYSALILCQLIFTSTWGLLDLLIEELSFWMVLFINSLYTMDISIIEWQLVWGDQVGVLLDLKHSLNQLSLPYPWLTWQSSWGVWWEIRSVHIQVGLPWWPLYLGWWRACRSCWSKEHSSLFGYSIPTANDPLCCRGNIWSWPVHCRG